MKSKNGFSLIIAIIVIVLFAALGIAGLTLLATETRISVDTMFSTKAFFIAEGGLQYYLEQLENQTSSWAVPPAVPTNKVLANGTFTITAKNAADNEIDVISEARVTGASGETVVRVTRIHVSRLSGPGNVPAAFHFASYAENHINFGNDATNTSVVNGNLCAKMNISIGSGWTHNGTASPNTELDFPWCDFNQYKTWVQETYGSGYVKSGNYTFTVAGSPYSGVYFVGGNVTIDAGVTINGGVVTEGGINMNGAHGAKITASAGIPALVAKQAINIQNSAGVKVKGQGLIYAEQGISIRNVSGGSEFYGTFIADNNFTISGGSTEGITITFNPSILVNPPPFFQTGSPSFTRWTESYLGGY